MTLQRVNAPPSVYDEARSLIAAWERGNEKAPTRALILVRDGGDEYEVLAAGPDVRPTEVAGLLFAAAQLVLE